MTIGAQMATTATGYVERWSKVGEAAQRARSVPANRLAALFIVVLYNAIGFADVASTLHGLSAGAVEANPIVAAAMESLAHYWVAPKLACQLLVTAMIVWFPHRFVLTIFSIAVAATGIAVVNNMLVAASL
ncbi:DUF5658 family protein [Parvularcula dongshanensis]|uniref:DUF5658 domain-containing protein n=1 Tax=Parvularcula dongshanensis TaxID=1173995 RepID=A0A840I2N2_9PROT|nr:DUF5658 family protein [Parvularcula dongshanensis]MBB4658595.1 hypothetical protein [Parvularcula dongshanensis]